MQGSCNYGYIWQDEPLGWNVAAMTDYDADYQESCSWVLIKGTQAPSILFDCCFPLNHAAQQELGMFVCCLL